MTTYAALLRAVNLAGQKSIAMADLRALLASLGFVEAQSLLQSGNLVFRGVAQAGATLERLLETQAAKRLSLETDFFVRSPKEWRALVAANPLPEQARRDPARLVVVFLKGPPREGAVEELQSAIAVKGPELARVVGREAYIAYPDGIGRSRVTMALIEKKLGVRGTGRNWNTVLKLAALLGV